MTFSYHAPTRSRCEICEKLLAEDNALPIINSSIGKASSANGFPFHGWYNFVLGYTPSFPEFIINREGLSSQSLIFDPFAGSGTTQLVAKLKEIPSTGIDANDFMVYCANHKLNWHKNADLLKEGLDALIEDYYRITCNYSNDDYMILARNNRPTMLEERYFSDLPFGKWIVIKQLVSNIPNEELKESFEFALSAIIVPASNVKYGPGFGIGKMKADCDVLKLFTDKILMMIQDLKKVTPQQIDTPANIFLGDSREALQYVQPNSVSSIITSPPYPGDHEYTKYSRLELILNEMATDLHSFRKIKKRMLRASTTNIYKDDKDAINVKNIASIKEVTDEIDRRLQADGATSGFEKLYTKLIWEYFGGMYLVLKQCYDILVPGGKMSLLVSDSHAFKMVHISTAELLKDVAYTLGYKNITIELWQKKFSSSHGYLLRENILTLEK